MQVNNMHVLKVQNKQKDYFEVGNHEKCKSNLMKADRRVEIIFAAIAH